MPIRDELQRLTAKQRYYASHLENGMKERITRLNRPGVAGGSNS